MNSLANFTNVIGIDCGCLDTTTPITLIVNDPATWYKLQMSPDVANTDITHLVKEGTIKADWYKGQFLMNELGVYFFNLNFTFSGSASANYKIRAILNDTTLIKPSETQFTTRGSNVRWEVGMTFLIDLGYNVDTNINSGLYSSKNTITMQFQNVGGSGNLSLENGLYNVMKIG